MGCKMADALGDRMKEYEGMEASRAAMKRLPLLVRIDGKGFSRWTKGLEYPFDARLEALRREVTRALVEEMGAVVGYCQSDEITLVLWARTEKEALYCGGKFMKVVSHAASIATAQFNLRVPQHIPEKSGQPAMFVARAWCVPNLHEAANAVLWREQDATKNSVSMAARSTYSHREIIGKNTSQLQEMLWERGINWDTYPSWAKRGTYLGRRSVGRRLTPEEIADLPPLHNARKDPDMIVTRTGVHVLDLPPLSRVENRVGVLFHGEDPVVAQGRG
jgi:tRNA(His) 5'-end guanylyltransferase